MRLVACPTHGVKWTSNYVKRIELLSSSKTLLLHFISRKDSQFAVHCSVYWKHNLSGFAVKYLGPKSSFFALSNSRFQIVWYISGVQKDGIHGNQKLKMTGSCYTAQWRWIVFLGGLCNNGQKGGVKPEGGHHVNYSLKEGALGSYLKKRVSLYKKKVTNGVSVPPVYRNCHKVLRPF